MQPTKARFCSRFWGITESRGGCRLSLSHPTSTLLKNNSLLVLGSALEDQKFTHMCKFACFMLFVTITLCGTSVPASGQGLLSISRIGGDATAGDTGLQMRESEQTDYQSQQFYTPEREYGWADRATTGRTYTTGTGTLNSGDYMGPALPQVLSGAIAEQSVAKRQIRSGQYGFGFNQGGTPSAKWGGYDYYNPAPIWQDNYDYPGGSYSSSPSYLFSGGNGLSNPFPF